MYRIYSAAHLPEAYLVKHLLESAGFEVFVRNENAQGATGELPFTHTYPELWLSDPADQRAARKIVESYENRLKQEETVVICPQCKEQNPGSFDYCWACQHPLGPEG